MDTATTGTGAEKRETPRMYKLYWAKRSMTYGSRESSRKLARGQVFKLEGLVNDAALVDLGYVGEVPEGVSRYPCRECGAEFIDQRMRDAHGDRAHREDLVLEHASPPPRMDGETVDAYRNRVDEWAKQAGAKYDSTLERRIAEEDAQAPLDLTKTTASRT